jgi:hypothetical protein
MVLVGLGLVFALGTAPTVALSAGQAPASSESSDEPIAITVGIDRRIVKTGDSIEFESVVTNTGSKRSRPLVIAMNIVNLGSGDPVDPEDWSPERTQSVDPLAPGESATNPWTVDAILDGDYMVYMVVIPDPKGPRTTSRPVSSSGIHLSVAEFIRLNPNGVTWVALAMPITLTLCLFGLRWIRRRSYVEEGSSEG